MFYSVSFTHTIWIGSHTQTGGVEEAVKSLSCPVVNLPLVSFGDHRLTRETSC